MTETLPDIPRLVTGVAEWMACLVYVLVLPRRWSWPGTIAALAVGLVGLVGLQLLVAQLPLQLWLVGMVLAVLAMGALVSAIARVKPADVGYVTARAFVLAELMASLAWQLHTFYLYPLPQKPWAGEFLLGAVFLTGFGIAYLLERRHFSTAGGPGVGPRTLFIVIAMVIITFSLSNLSFITPNTPFSGQISIQVFYIRTLVDLAGYMALYAQHEQLRKQRADLEVAAMDAMLRTQHDQYLAAKRDMETVSRTHHDLKHQVAALRAEMDPGRRGQWLDSLEATINAFGELYDTGHAVADTILTSKARYCRSRGVNFTCVADGSLLGFIKPMDLATILGNALDNAIESVLRLPEPEQRIVRVAIFSQVAFVVMRFENYFDGQLRYQDGELATRKVGGGMHGLGVKSIRHTAAKYGGRATVSGEENWFTLTVLLPVPLGKSAQLKPMRRRAAL